ncbi:MAG TPA: hypothetical protein VEH84_08085 [Alphaproteobacteria bacterium]|nr:hypothetical protein [Alphaproteobacteria bacterium]
MPTASPTLQPLSQRAPLRWRRWDRPQAYSLAGFPILVVCDRGLWFAELEALRDWCQSRFGPRRGGWDGVGSLWGFRSAEDLDAFLSAWEGAAPAGQG